MYIDEASIRPLKDLISAEPLEHRDRSRRITANGRHDVLVIAAVFVAMYGAGEENCKAPGTLAGSPVENN
jgi:hypothetical protein